MLWILLITREIDLLVFPFKLRPWTYSFGANKTKQNNAPVCSVNAEKCKTGKLLMVFLTLKDTNRSKEYSNKQVGKDFTKRKLVKLMSWKVLSVRMFKGSQTNTFMICLLCLWMINLRMCSCRAAGEPGRWHRTQLFSVAQLLRILMHVHRRVSKRIWLTNCWAAADWLDCPSWPTAT